MGETNFLLSVPLYRKCFKCTHIGKKKEENFGFRAVTNVSTLHQRRGLSASFHFFFDTLAAKQNTKQNKNTKRILTSLKRIKNVEYYIFPNSNLYLRNDG